MFFFITQFPMLKDLIFWAMAMLASIASAFWLNDYFDFDDDRANTRKILHREKKDVLYPAILALALSLGAGAFVSREVLYTVGIISVSSLLYSSPVIRLKTRIYFPFLIHFFMGIVFFQSASSMTNFSWSYEARLIALFWGLILGTGSLGNELVDQKVDENAKIKTVANTFPSLIRWLILGIQGLALWLLVVCMVYLNLRITLAVSGVSVMMALFWFLRNKDSMGSKMFRRIYRITFVIVIIAFHAEKFFRN